MNIKELVKLQANETLYGKNWLNPSWRQSFMTSFQKYSKQDFNMNGGAYPNIESVTSSPSYEQQQSAVDVASDIATSTDILKFKIEDKFVTLDTKSMLYGQRISPYYTDIILAIMKYYNKQTDIVGNTELKRNIIKYIHEVFDKNPNITFQQVMKAFDSQTVECLLAYFLICYQTNRLDLILRTTYTFARVLPLKCKSEWFDNYRLNAYGNILNMVMYKEYDTPYIFTINDSPKPINKSVRLDFYPKIIKFLVGSLRAFIILNKLYPTNNNHTSTKQSIDSSHEQEYDNSFDDGMAVFDSETMSGGSFSSTIQTTKADHSLNETEFSDMFASEKDALNLPEFINEKTLNEYQISADDSFYTNELVDPNSNDVMRLLKGSGMSDEMVCDECYLHYPFFFGGSHGCDVFTIPQMSLSIDEITQFLERYPSARVGYILNIATYRSGNGQHWVALELTQGHAKLICSQKSDFSVFRDPALREALNRNNYKLEHNTKSIQRDDYACGAYAFVSLMELLRLGDIEKAVEAIGVNMGQLGKDVGKESSADRVRRVLTGWDNMK